VFSRSGGARRLLREATLAASLFVVSLAAIAWWYFADRPSMSSGAEPPSLALREYIDAAKRKDCPAVIAFLSRRSRELAEMRVAGRSTVERSFCDYSPATADLSEFETDRIRLEDVAGSTAHVSASYTYERLFGFFGRGRARHIYTFVLEDGRWRVDLVENLDPESRPNQDRRAMFLVHQTWTALRDLRSKTGTITGDASMIRAALPGFRFPEIRSGVADSSAPADTLFVTTGPSVGCISLRSASGTLVMIKIPADAKSLGTYDYGSRTPTVCDDQPLSRPYYGTSSGIK
jgi:hypothetical protein